MTCDSVTGVCQCLPGATGENCDQCMEGWINIPREGCQGMDKLRVEGWVDIYTYVEFYKREIY